MQVINANYTLLIVDSSEQVLNLLETSFLNQGFKVLKSQTVNGAMQLIDDENPDMVISEVVMPEQSGYDLCHYIRNKSNNKRIPFIFLTTVDDSDSILQGFQVGADDYVLKPINLDILTARIHHQLSMFRAKRVLIEKNFELHNIIFERDKMYSVIAHDLRSPISTVKMILNLLAENIKEEMVGEVYYKMLGEVNYITEDVFTLLDNLLKWGKNKTGTMTPLFQEIDLVGLTKGAVGLFKTVALVKKIQIEFSTIPSAIVSVDIEMLKSCIRNLMSNAFKFSYENNKIIVSLSEEPDFFKISVQDFGCGMDEKTAQGLLHPRTHTSTYGTAQEEGLGLGLLLVREMIEKNKGRLTFETKKDSGSTFSLHIPKPK